MITLEAIMAEARTWVGTPFHHHACLKGVGVDCAMLLVGIGRSLGIVAPTWTPELYSPQWHLHQQAERYCALLEAQGAARVTRESYTPGQILLFRWLATQPASHAAIAMPSETIIHAVLTKNPRHARVRHERMPTAYRACLAYAYAWPGVEDE